MRLYEINEILENATQDGERFITEDGQVFTVEEFEELAMDRDEKIENLLLWVKNLRAEATAIKTEREALEKREKAARKKADKIAEFLQGILQGEKFSTARVKVSYRYSKSVEADVNLIPEEFVRTTVTREPDKAALKEALLALGEDEHINGAMLVENVKISIK